MRKLTAEEFIERARLVHGDKYDYSKVNYINCSTKVCIICPIHGEFWQIPNDHLRGFGCALCSHELISKKQAKSKEEFVSQAVEIHGNKYDYSKVEYINSNTKVCVICNDCGTEFWVTPKDHIHKKSGCPFCRRVILSKAHSKGLSKFIEEAKVIYGNKYDYSKVKYINNKTKVCIICPIHGEFWVTPNDFLDGHACSLCSGMKKKDNQMFIAQAKEVHGDRYDYSLIEYVNNRTPIKIICPEHGIFEQRPVHHLRGRGCPCCANSNGESAIEKFLNSHKIGYIEQYRVQVERKMFARNNLRVDFYIPQHNVIIEFNGIQHYEYTPFFHRYDDAFARQVDRDKRLKEYCKKKGIKLIVIKYDQIDKIDKKLKFLLK